MNNSVPSDAGNSIALQPDAEARASCAICKKEIVDGHWFCRLPGKERPILLCAPSCALRYFDRQSTNCEPVNSNNN